MNFPDYFCEHLNKAKELVRTKELVDFPIIYRKSSGFERYATSTKDVGDHEFILSGSERNEFLSEHCQPLHSNYLYVHFSGNLEREILNGLNC